MAGKGEEAREMAKDEAKVAVLQLLEPFRDLVCLNKVCLSCSDKIEISLLLHFPSHLFFARRAVSQAMDCDKLIAAFCFGGR
jgi:hypothetical protein